MATSGSIHSVLDNGRKNTKNMTGKSNISSFELILELWA